MKLMFWLVKKYFIFNKRYQLIKEKGRRRGACFRRNFSRLAFTVQNNRIDIK
jgi:hypothetical protein